MFDTRRRDIPPFARLAFDSVLVLATALDNYHQDGWEIREISMDALGDSEVHFEDGHKLFEYLKEVRCYLLFLLFLDSIVSYIHYVLLFLIFIFP